MLIRYSTIASSVVAAVMSAQSFPAQILSPVRSARSPLPVADAGDPQLARPGQLVHLDGTRSFTRSGSPLTYQWSIREAPAGSVTAFDDATSPIPRIRLDQPGDYQLELIVNDGGSASLPANLVISTQSAPPVASAGLSRLVDIGSLVTLDGSQSHNPNPGSLAYSWTLAPPRGSTATLQSADSPFPTLMPDRDGDYLATLVVTSRQQQSQPVSVLISTNGAPPHAVASAPVAKSNKALVFDGSQSVSPGGLPLQYHWILLSSPAGSVASLLNANASAAQIVPDVAGLYIAQLCVTDGLGADCRTVAADSSGSRGFSVAGSINELVARGSMVQLQTQSAGVSSGLQYRWDFLYQPPTSSALLTPSSTGDPSFVADVPGDYVLQLTGTDGETSRSTNVLVSTRAVPPVPLVSGASSMNAGDRASMDGVSSYPMDQSMNYSWSPLAGGIEDMTTSSNPSISFTGANAGSSLMQLRLSNSRFASYSVKALNVSSAATTGSGTTGLSLSVTSSAQGTNLTLTITPTGTLLFPVATGSKSGITAADFGQGITVQSYAEDATGASATVSINIDDTAPLGFHTVILTFGGSVFTGVNSFNVVGGTYAITSISPASAPANSTLSVSITGQLTHFTQYSPAVSFSGSGITVQSINVIDDHHLAVGLNISPQAPTGYQLMSLSSNINSLLVATFDVLPLVPYVQFVNPQLIGPGQQVVTVTGAYTNWNSSTTANFGSNITVVSVSVVNSNSANVTVNVESTVSPGRRNITMTTGQEVDSGTVTAARGLSLSVGASAQGTNLTLALGPVGTVAFPVGGRTTAGMVNSIDFGPGVTVQTFSETSEGSSISVSINVEDTAAVGAHTVTVNCGGVYFIASNAFNVVGGTYVITSVSPASAPANSTADLSITGQLTHFTQYSPSLSFSGSGITVQSISVVDDHHLTAVLVIPPQAPVGYQLMSVSSNTNSPLVAAFQVLPLISYVQSVSPQPLGPGQQIVTVTGAYTNWNSSTTADFGSNTMVTGISVLDNSNAIVALSVQTEVSPGRRSMTMTTGTKVDSGSVNVGRGLSLSAGSAGQGSDLTLTLGPRGTPAFPVGSTKPGEPPACSIDFGSGITVTSFYEYATGSGIEAQISVSQSAQLGLRTVTANCGGVFFVGLNAFTVVAH